MIPLVASKEFSELKKMAAVNLESALLAAVRIGAMRSGNAAKPIKRAAAILEYESESIKAGHTIGNVWHDAEAKREHDEYKRVAKALRDLLTPQEGK